ncbi:uncharacterized protein [Halyomorpha halys]|uniref:uncharacterized protein isoform X2 n=1 Tax=Halyomorpha halys TaxID=286706 RepID=UPI0006D4EBF3|nr:uncharacterized protein LOC106679177 isoform X2 [Halyomorpha halys]
MKILSFDFRYVFILDCYIYTIMDRNSKPPVSKYLGTFFLDSAQKSEDGSNGNYKTYGLPSKKDDSSSCVHVTTLSSGLEEMSNKDNIDEIWGSDFPEDFSEDCIILEPKSESDDIDVQIISSNSDYADVRKDKRPEPNIEKTRPALLMDRFSHQSQIPKKASVGPATSKSTLTISSSQCMIEIFELTLLL